MSLFDKAVRQASRAQSTDDVAGALSALFSPGWPESLKVILQRFPFVTTPAFIGLMGQLSNDVIPPNLRPHAASRLKDLRQIAANMLEGRTVDEIIRGLQNRFESEKDTSQQAFLRASSLDDMRQVVDEFPVLIAPEFLGGIEYNIEREVPPNERQLYRERLEWLRRISQERQ